MLLRRIFFSLIFTCACCFASPFDEFDKYQETVSKAEVEKKIGFHLLHDASVGDCLTITNTELTLFNSPEKNEKEFVLRFGTKPKPTEEKLLLPTGPKPLSGVRIAIDPGHMGGKMAVIEERFINMDLKSYNGLHVEFDEGTLATNTAKILRSYLTQLGAEVLLTRDEPGKSVYPLSFEQWCKEKGTYLQQESENSDQAIKKLFKAFNICDLEERARIINNFNPHAVVIIHYNATENVTLANYNLAFVPGCFLSGELAKKNAHYEFMRLLLSNNIEKSAELSRNITTCMEKILKVPLMTNDTYQKNISHKVENGIYNRNLVLTRLVHAPICYGETLNQNNEDEAYRLAQETAQFDGVTLSPRVIEVAQAYFIGLCKYFGIATDTIQNNDK